MKIRPVGAELFQADRQTCVQVDNTLAISSQLFFFFHKTYEDGIGYSETSAYKIQTPGYHPKERIKQT